MEFVSGAVTVRGVNAAQSTVNVTWEAVIPMFQTVHYHELSYPPDEDVSISDTAAAAAVDDVLFEEVVSNNTVSTEVVGESTEDTALSAEELQQINPGTVLEFVRPTEASEDVYPDYCITGRVTVLSSPADGAVMVGWLNSTHSLIVQAVDLRRPPSTTASTTAPAAAPAGTAETIGLAGTDQTAVTQEVAVVPPARMTLRHMMNDKNPVRALDNYLLAVEDSYRAINLDDISLEKDSEGDTEKETEEKEDMDSEDVLAITSNMSIPDLEFAGAVHKGLEMVTETPMSIAGYMVMEDMLQVSLSLNTCPLSLSHLWLSHALYLYRICLVVF